MKTALKTIVTLGCAVFLLLHTQECAAIPPPLVAYPGLINFGKFISKNIFTIGNYHDEAGCWRLEILYVNSGTPWITVDQDFLCLQEMEEKSVTVTVNREGLSAGTYTALIWIVSQPEGYDESLVTITLEALGEGQQLVLSTERAFFDQHATESTLSILNTGKGTLVWNIGAVKYSSNGYGWLTVDPVAGAAKGGEQTSIHMRIAREGLKPGFYSAIAQVYSNGGVKNIIILMRVPLF